jgi:osmotically inducible lipoprotein OsmB
MHKFIIVGVAGLMLAGCQSAGPNQMIGTGVGAVGGYGVAQAMGAGPRGSAIGAVAGALVGSSVGQNLDQQNQPQYAPPPRRVSCYSVWDRTYRGDYIERKVCE